MSKNINRAKTIVRKLSHFRTELLAKEYRKLAGYPENGFSSENEYRSFIKNHKGDDYFASFMVALIQIRKDIKPHIDTANFYDIFKDLYLYGKISNKTIESINDTGCEWLAITEGSLKSDKEKLKSGLYIKIGEYADITHLKKFVSRDGKLFRGYKRLIWGEKKYGRIRASYLFKRNERIIALSKMTQVQRKNICGIESKNRSVQISYIISKEGYGGLSDGTVRKIIQENKEQ